MAHWLDKILPTIRNTTKRRNTIPEGLWRKCPKCDAVLYKPELERALSVCPKCQHHLRINARKRIDMMLDSEGREEIASQVEPIDKLKFRDSKRYRDRIAQAQRSTDERDALVAIRGTMNQLPVVVTAFEFEFMGGSMGSVVGEKFVAAAGRAYQEKIPLLCFSASGGARMQEALFSLMQMAKTAAVLQKLKTNGIPYISIMTDPVYGGVSASLAMLGDVNLAEPNALIGFAGPRVIEQTVRQKLPEGFQRSEFLLEHGMLDMIVHRHDLKQTLTQLIMKFGYRLPQYQSLLEQYDYASLSQPSADISPADVAPVSESKPESTPESTANPSSQTVIESNEKIFIAEQTTVGDDEAHQQGSGKGGEECSDRESEGQDRSDSEREGFVDPVAAQLAAVDDLNDGEKRVDANVNSVTSTDQNSDNGKKSQYQ